MIYLIFKTFFARTLFERTNYKITVSATVSVPVNLTITVTVTEEIIAIIKDTYFVIVLLLLL